MASQRHMLGSAAGGAFKAAYLRLIALSGAERSGLALR
jgi:hypothetical protein